MSDLFVRRMPLKAVPIDRAPFAVREIVGAEGNQPAIGVENVKVTSFETLQIQGPGVLKSHAGKAEGMRADTFQEQLPSSQAGPLRRRATTTGGSRPKLSLKLSSLYRAQPGSFTTTAGLPGMRCAPGFELASRHEHEIPVKGTETVLGTRGTEMLRLDQPSRLLLDFREDLRDGNAGKIMGKTGISAEITHRLKVHSANAGKPFDGILDDGTDKVRIHPGHQGRHQDHPQLMLPAMVHGRLFFPRQRSPSEFHGDLVVESVKLEKHAREAGLLQFPAIVRFPGQAQAVGIELNEIKADRMAKGDDFRQVVANRGLSSRELDITRSGSGQQRLEPSSNLGQVRIVLSFLPGIGKADGAREVTSVRYLQEGATGLLPMLGAKATIPGTPLGHNGLRRLGIGGGFGSAPGSIRRFPTPDDRLERTMLWA